MSELSPTKKIFKRNLKNPLDKATEMCYNKNVRYEGSQPDRKTDSRVKEKRLLLTTLAKQPV